MHDSIRSFAWLGVVLALAVGAAQAGETAEAAETAKSEPSMEEMMAAMVESQKPGPMHHRLAELEGQWEAQTRMFMGPDTEPVTGRGAAVNQMIMDGRFLQMDYKGMFMGQPFVGVGIEGYDTTLGKHVAIWYDSMSTGIARLEGDVSDDGKTTVAFADMVDPMTGETKKVKAVTTIKSSNVYTFEWYESTDGENWTKAMDIVYTRTKGTESR